MAVDHGPCFGIALIGGAVNEPFEIGIARIAAHRRAVEHELHDVAALDKLGAARAGQEVALRIARVAKAHMAIGVDHVFVSENAVGDHQVTQSGFEIVRGIGHE